MATWSLSSPISFQIRWKLPIVKFAAGLYGTHSGACVAEPASQAEPNWRLSGWFRSAELRASVQESSGRWTSSPLPTLNSSVGSVCFPLNYRILVVHSLYSNISVRR